MATISDFANLSIGLSATPPSTASFGVPILMVDSTDVPIDKKFIITAPTTYTTDLTAASDAYTWCTTLWGQNQNPEKAYIGRWVKTASSPYIIAASPAAVGDWTGLSTGSLKITDGTNSDEVTGLDFTSATDLDDVAQVIETALQAIASPNITGLDTSTTVYDDLGRILITNSTTGAAAAGISTTTVTSGTDIAAAAYLGSTIYSQEGLDAQTLGTSLNNILAVDNTPFVVCERGASISEQVAFATSVNALDKILILVVNDTDAKNSALSSDAGYQINALGYQKVHVEYTEWSTQEPDAAVCGEIFPQKEATVSLALTPLTGVSESGQDTDGTTVIPLTPTEVSALKDKGYDYLVKPATLTHFATGLASGGNEIRIMYGKMFCEAKVNEEVYGYLVSNNVVTFSDTDINAIKGIVEYWLGEMVNRKVLEEGYTVTMPAAADFTAAQKATHIMDLDNITEAETQRSVNKVNISLSWAV
jgi:hypothetical protein